MTNENVYTTIGWMAKNETSINSPKRYFNCSSMPMARTKLKYWKYGAGILQTPGISESEIRSKKQPFINKRRAVLPKNSLLKSD